MSDEKKDLKPRSRILNADESNAALAKELAEDA
jgi:hypothetical protein